MTWAKLDDGFFDHPKARAAGKDGRELFLAALCHAARNLTDGWIAETDLPLLAAKAEVAGQRTARRLVEVGWWHQVDGGWVIHDYHAFNPRRADVEARRDAERRKKARQRSRGAEQVDRHPDGRFVSRGDTPRDDAGDTLGDTRRDSPATRPVPSRPTTRTCDVTHASSSSYAGDDEDEHSISTIDQAFRIIAVRRLEARNTALAARGGQPITEPHRRDAWIREDMTRSRLLLGHLAHAYLADDPDLDARQLADALDTPVAATLAGWKPESVDTDA